MKKIFCVLVMCLIVGMLLTGCGEDEKPAPKEEPKEDTKVITSSPSEDEPEDDEAAPAPKEEPKTVSYELTSAERAKVESAIETGKTLLSSSFKSKMKVGDAYVFALAVKNVNPKEENFRIMAKFIEAKSSSGGMNNNIEADSEFMLSWLSRTDFSSISLGSQDHAILPIVVEIGDERSPGIKTVPGTYTFEVWIQHEQSRGFWEQYSNERHSLAVKID